MSYIDLIQAYPKITIVIFALAISFFISLINYFFLDKERMREIKARQKATQEKIKTHQKAGEHEKAMALQKELFPDMMEMMKLSFKPMLITFIPIILLFSLMRKIYVDTSIAGSWFWYYFVTALVGSIIFRKLFKLP